MRGVILFALVLAVVCIAGLVYTLFRKPRLARGSGGGRVASHGQRVKLSRVAPTAELVITELPRFEARKLLEHQGEVAPPAVDFGLIGVDEDRDAADERIWRSVKRALSTRGKKTLASGES